MVRRDIVDDLTDIVLPVPAVFPEDPEPIRDGMETQARRVREQREGYEDNARLAWDEGDLDPLLVAISDARRQKLEAEKRMRLLVAYGREFVEPRPYRLDDLAQSAGMSISGTRTTYDEDDITEVAKLTGRRPRTRTTGTGS